MVARLQIKPDERQWIVLDVLASGDTAGIRVACGSRGVSYRGAGPADYACGRCGAPLALGVRPGMFSFMVFECRCGAMNRLPDAYGSCALR